MLATDNDMPLILLELERAEKIGVDTETTGLNVRNNVDYLMGICVATLESKFYIPFRHHTDNLDRQWVEPLMRVLETKPLAWHNMKFDFHSLKTLGVDPLRFSGPQYDVLLMAHLINEEIYNKGLDSLAKMYLNREKEQNLEIHKIGDLYGWDAFTPSVLAPYAETDPELTLLLANIFLPELKRQNLQDVYFETELPFSKLLYKMEQRGVWVNHDLADTLNERGKARMATIKRKLHFNPASPKDLGEYLLDELGLPVLAKTPKGKPSFNKVAMEGYDEILEASNNETAKLIAEFRGWQKATSSLYQPLLNRVGPDGRIRTQFKQHGTVTGRLSASEPNLQQVPRGSSKPWNGKAKSCFGTGDPLRSLFGWDYSQLELRLAAAYGREQILLTEFEKDDADPFAVLAKTIFDVLTAETRQDTKTFVYANLFGAGLAKIDATLGWNDISRTEPVFRKYRQSIPGIVDVSQKVNRLMEMKGVINYWDNRRRHIRKRDERHKAWNSLIQGGGAQLVKNAMLRCETFEDSNCEMVLTVHDEITFNITTEAIPDYEPMIIKAMTDWPDFGVKFAVKGKEWK